MATALGRAGSAALFCFLACSSDTSSKQTDPATGQTAPICDAKRPATAYQAKLGATAGVAITGVGTAPTPCFELTGYASSETSLAVSKSGTVFVAPVITADGAGVLRSKDQGDHWEVIMPAARGGATHQRVQPIMHMDSDSERLLFATTTSNPSTGFNLSISDDAGETWSPSQVGVGAVDWLKFVSGPPVSSTPMGFKNVVYASAPTPISTAFANQQQVQRSLDGGKTWTGMSGTMLPLKPADNGCPTTEWVIYGSGVVTPDGSIYLGLRRCAAVGIAISRDEGQTWTVGNLPGATLIAYGGLFSHQTLFNLMVAEPLATDSAGNLYALWNDDKDVLQLAVSRDRAVTWSTPVAIAPPGIEHTVFASAALKAEGVLAVAFYGSDDNQATYNAYVAETQNALDPEPTFWGARLNSPQDPALFSEGFDLGYGDVLTGGDLVEIIQLKYGPDGDIWTSFAKDMCPGQDRSHCTWDLSMHNDAPFQLGIGRLQHPK